MKKIFLALLLALFVSPAFASVLPGGAAWDKAPVVSMHFQPNTEKTIDSRVAFTRSQTAGGKFSYYNSQGVLSYADANEPRFDYDPVTLAYKGIRHDTDAENYVLYSSDMSQSAWTATNASITANSATSPDGTQNAAVVVTTGIGGATQIPNHVSTTGQPLQTSCFFKWVSGDTTLRLLVASQEAFGGTGGDRYVEFNGSTGAFIAKSTEVTSYKIRNVGNGWWRVSGRWTSTASASFTMGCEASQTGTTFQAFGGQFLYTSGSSITATTYYIPTGSASVSEGGDTLYVSSVPWFSLTKGTIIVKGSTDASAWSGWAVFSDGTATNEINLMVNDPSYGGIIASCGGTGGGLTSWNIPLGTETTLGASYDWTTGTANNYCAQSGSNSVGNSTSATQKTGLNRLYLGARGNNAVKLSGWLQGFAYYSYPLTSTQLLTAVKGF